MNQNTLERIFRSGSEGKRRFSPIKNTGERFSGYCRNLIEENGDFSRSVIHTGFGIPKNGEIPLRLPVILIPALEIMKGLLQFGITPPRFIIYQATGIISQINGIDISDALRISESMQKILQQFIHNNFPELLSYIELRFGEQSQDIHIQESIFGYAEQISTLLNSDSQNNFQKSEQKHSNVEGKSLFYVAANTYYNGGFREYPFSDIENPDVIIPIGGRSETDFFRILLETQQSCRNIFPLITQLGAFPTYYVNPRGDMKTKEDIRDTSLHPDIQKDLHVLQSYHI